MARPAGAATLARRCRAAVAASDCAARGSSATGASAAARTLPIAATQAAIHPPIGPTVVNGGGPVAAAPPRLRPSSEVAGTGDGADDAEDDLETAPLDELLDPTAPLSRPLEPCPEPTPNARSGRDGEPMVVHWLNTARFPVELYIVDYEGARWPSSRYGGSTAAVATTRQKASCGVRGRVQGSY